MRAFALKYAPWPQSKGHHHVLYEIREDDGTTVVEQDSVIVASDAELRAALMERAAKYAKKSETLTMGEVSITPDPVPQPTAKETFLSEYSKLVRLHSYVQHGVLLAVDKQVTDQEMLVKSLYKPEYAD